MNVKEAVHAAKQYAADLFSEEQISNLGLEEVDRDFGGRLWKITLGLSRPWNSPRTVSTLMTGEATQKRVYKVFYVSDDTGEINRVEMRAPVSD